MLHKVWSKPFLKNSYADKAKSRMCCLICKMQGRICWKEGVELTRQEIVADEHAEEHEIVNEFLDFEGEAQLF